MILPGDLVIVKKLEIETVPRYTQKILKDSVMLILGVVNNEICVLAHGVIGWLFIDQVEHI
jgi:hypothetical protein